MDEVERHNRQAMLLRVKRYWLVGVLQESLHGAELIDLSMAYRTTAVASRNAPEWQNIPGLDGAAFEQPLPIGTQIPQVYEQAQGTLLIMGEPGAGKTTTLLQLVSDLLRRAEVDENHPIPVVFSLASWHNHVGIGAWMVNELANRYEAPAWLGEEWLHNGRLLPLLDGLDEVDQTVRIECAQAINEFRRKYVRLPTVVTCRTQDYKALATRLKLDEAVVLQPLSGAQIDQYLASMGSRLAGLRAAIQSDTTLRELAESPLMLSIMTLAYYRMPQEAAIALGGREEGRAFLFDTYVERMTRYRGGEELYNPQDSIRWLAWLARQMSKFNQTMFFLENMQPNWLPRPAERSFVEKLRFTIGGWFLGLGLLAGVLGWLLAGWPGLALGGAAGLVTAVLPTFFRILLLHTRVNWHRIETVETLSWSWPWAWLGGALGTIGGFALGGLGSALGGGFS
ncbi:MAG TPA: NACHT domain-containing protein, partial [Anaerolineae bacterium]|nr:NACHT domain-containing protein [Anaerolineae bacterium]